jgi:hypothetical protein
MRNPPDDGKSQMNQTPSTKKGEKMAEMKNTLQSKQETPRIIMSNVDEDAEMDTTNMDGYGQKTGGETQTICMETNTSTSEQNEEANTTLGTANASPQDASVGEAGKRMEQMIRDREKGIATDYSGGEQDDPAPLTGGATMATDTTSPKRTKKLRTEHNVSPPLERERAAKPRHQNLAVTNP